MSRHLRDLANAEVMSWKLDELEYQTSERQGPVEVWHRGVLIASFPFYAHWVGEGQSGRLHIFDPVRACHVRTFERDQWSEVGHHLHRGMLFGDLPTT